MQAKAVAYTTYFELGEPVLAQDNGTFIKSRSQQHDENRSSRNVTYKFCTGTHHEMSLECNVDIVEDGLSIAGCVKI